jgi:NAD(P)-dependent dehydrogenase (short-subunit alcohol dehydrogenase family)
VTRTALVAGVGPTIGEAVARTLHDAGLQVGLFARSREYIDDLAADLGDEAVAVPTDVTDPEAVADGAAVVRQALGPVDVLVYNASAPGGRPLAEATPDSFADVWRTRTFGAFACLRELAGELETVLVSGTNYASDGSPRQVEWGSAAAATKGLARSVAGEGGLGDDARVVYVEIATAVAPPERDAPWMTSATDVAATYRDLLEGPAGFHTYRIDGDGDRDTDVADGSK